MLTNEIINLFDIGKLPLFIGISSILIEELLLRHFEPVNLKYGEILLREGEENSDLYLILNGRLGLLKESEQNRHIKELGSGEMVNEFPLLKKNTANATVIAVRDSFILKLNQEALEKVFHKHPKEGLLLLQNIANYPSNISNHKTFFLFFDSQNIHNRQIADSFRKALTKYGTCRIVNKDNILKHHDHIDAWLARQHAQFSFIIYESCNEDFELTKLLLPHADRALILCDANESPSIGYNTEQIFLEAKQLHKNIDLVLIQSDSAKYPANTNKWLEQLSGVFWHHIRETSSADIERVARIVSGHSITLVFGGGGAKALVFIGFYKALRELGIPIDWVGGSCAGAMLTTAIAMLLSPEEMVEKIKRFAPKSLLEAIDFTLPIVSLSSGKSMARFFKLAFPDINLEDLWINNFCVTTNLTQSRVEILNKGPAWKALRTTTGIPIFLHPVTNDNGDLLVDGAVMNNLPVDIMKSNFKAGKVIAGRIKTHVLHAMNLSHHKFGLWNFIKDYFSGKLRYSHLNLFKMLDRTTMLASRQHAEQHAKLADFCMHYEVGHVGYFDYNSVDKLVELGYRLAMENAEELLNLKKNTHS